MKKPLSILLCAVLSVQLLLTQFAVKANALEQTDFISDTLCLTQDMNWEYKHKYDWSMRQMDIDGNYLYYTDNQNIYKADISDVKNPRVVVEAPYTLNALTKVDENGKTVTITPRNTTGLVVNGDYIYVGNRQFTAAYPTEEEIAENKAGAFFVLNKSDLSTVSVEGLPHKVSRILVYKNILILNLQLRGFRIYDITNPSAPSLLSEVSYPKGTASNQEVHGGDIFEYTDKSGNTKMYYAAAGFGDGIRLYDITDPTAPALSWWYKFSTKSDIKFKCHTFSLVVDYPYIYSTIAINRKHNGINYVNNPDSIQGILTLDITDIETLPESHKISNIDFKDRNEITTSSDSQPTFIAKVGKALVVNNDNKGIAIFDTTNNPDKPDYKGIYVPDNSKLTYRVFATEDGKVLFDNNYRLYMLDGIIDSNGETTVSKHQYSNACDTDCNICKRIRAVGAHKYYDDCDSTCNNCGETRVITHDYKAATCTKAKTCKVCGKTEGKALGHKYSNSCDTSCNNCGKTRSITHKYTKVTTKAATTSKNGYVLTECSVCGKDKSKTTIYSAKTVKLSYNKTTYNGKTKKPTVTVKDSKGKTISSKYYTVSVPSGRKSVGKYKYVIKFKGNYSGTKTLYLTINPPKTSVKKITAYKKSAKIYVNKKTTQVSGYQIQYSTSKKFTSAKTKTISSAKTTSATIKSLKAKKTYYVRVRTYKTVSGKKYYSGWSSYKKTKTK